MDIETIKIIDKIMNETDYVVIAHTEIFQEVDYEDKEFITSNGTIKFKELDLDDILCYSSEELEVEDNILEFIKDIKVAKKTIESFNAKKMRVFCINDDLVISPESLDELYSLEYLSEVREIELYEFNQVKISKVLKELK